MRADLTGKDVGIRQTQPGDLYNSQSNETRRLRKVTIMEVFVIVSCGVSIKHAQLRNISTVL